MTETYSLPHSRTTSRSLLPMKILWTRLLQGALDKTAKWAKMWKIKINANKSAHITFITANLYSENLETKDC